MGSTLAPETLRASDQGIRLELQPRVLQNMTLDRGKVDFWGICMGIWPWYCPCDCEGLC